MTVAASGAEPVPSRAHAAPALPARTEHRHRLSIGVVGLVLVRGL